MKYENADIKAATDALYAELTAAGFEVLLDDRDKKTSNGVKFADMELIGIPHRFVVSERGLAEGLLEYKGRQDAEAQSVARDGIVAFLAERLGR